MTINFVKFEKKIIICVASRKVRKYEATKQKKINKRAIRNNNKYCIAQCVACCMRMLKCVSC